MIRDIVDVSTRSPWIPSGERHCFLPEVESGWSCRHPSDLQYTNVCWWHSLLMETSRGALTHFEEFATRRLPVRRERRI